MRLLTLDQAPRNIGWAFGVTDASEPTNVGTVEFEPYGQNNALLARDFTKWLRGMVGAYRPDVIVFEQVVIRLRRINVRTLYQQFTMATAIEVLCGDQNIDSYDCDIGTWRKHFIGTGSAPKELKEGERSEWFKDKALERCAELGWPVPNHHAAEACGIWDYAAWKLDAAYASRWRKAENVRQAA